MSVTSIILILAVFVAIWSILIFIGNLALKSNVPAFNIIVLAISLGIIITYYTNLWKI